MKFGPVAIEDAEDAVLAHATVAGDRRLKKSHRLTRDDIDVLRAAGIAEVVAAVLADDDLDENAAAAAIASALGSAGIQVKPAATGRVNLHADWPETVLAARPFDAYTAVAAVTHDPKIDDFPLKAALDAGCFYVGALGSRKTHATRLERLAELGATPDDLARIHAPIGLDIGASSPSEIAVAVLAEIIRAFRTRGLGSGKGQAA